MRACEFCHEPIPAGSAFVYRGMLFHVEAERDCRMQFITDITTELLQACKSSLEGMLNVNSSAVREAGCFNLTPKDDECPCTAHQLRRVIAKAEGKQRRAEIERFQNQGVK